MDYEKLTVKTAVQLAAPHTWAASLLPALFGVLYAIRAGAALGLMLAAALMAICVLMQSGVNTINDFFDYVKGTDSREDCLEQSDAVLVYHRLRPACVLALGFGFLGAAACLGLYVILKSGPAPLAVGVVGGIAVLLYSGGPLPLSYLPVGELVSGVIMGGFIPLGILAAACGRLCFQILTPSLPFIMGIALIMMSNNGCDIEKDRAAGRRTLPVLLGRRRTRIVFLGAVIVWLAAICLLPWLQYGLRGLVSPAALVLFGRRPFGELMKAPMTQQQRVRQMKSVLRANLAGNGAYILALAAALA